MTEIFRDSRSALPPVFRWQRQAGHSVHRARWTEGPVWFGDLNCLLFSDIPNQRILRWSPDDLDGGGISVFRQPSNFANGHTRDRQGRLVSCEHGARRVTRTEVDGSVTVIADSSRWQATEFAQRCGGAIRRVDLVHRSDLRHPVGLRGLQVGARAGRAARFSLRPRKWPDRECRQRFPPAERACLFSRRDAALHRRQCRQPR